MPDLSVLIPARNEEWLGRTVEDVLAASTIDTEVIVVLDACDDASPVLSSPKVTVIRTPTPIGQRAAVNLAARLSRATHIMKLDAHCSVAPGFDSELIASCGLSTTVIPKQYNLHVFDWVCPNGHRIYQGPTPGPCATCGSVQWTRDVVWQRRRGTGSTGWSFDRQLHFQYWKEYRNRPEAQPDIAPVMTSLGACFLMRRDRFWDLGGLDEGHGSWGQLGVEVACKSWLSGGTHVVNKRTWYAHLFRTREGFGFPYKLTKVDIDAARAHSMAIWNGGQHPWPHTLQWLVDKFAPVPGWEETHDSRDVGPASEPVESAEVAPADPLEPPVVEAPVDRVDSDHRPARHRTRPAVGILYYSDAHVDPEIAETCRQQLLRAIPDHAELVSVTLQPLCFGHNIVLDDRTRGPLTLFEQILIGLRALQNVDLVFTAEHDILYHPSHYAVAEAPPDATFVYNEHTYKVDASSGRSLFYYTKQLSGVCARADTFLEHAEKRVARVQQEGFTRAMGFEPGTHRPPRGIDESRAVRRMSETPNIDIRHGRNLTQSRWRQDQFRNPRACLGWTEGDGVPGWGQTAGRFGAFLLDVRRGVHGKAE